MKASLVYLIPILIVGLLTTSVKYWLVPEAFVLWHSAAIWSAALAAVMLIVGGVWLWVIVTDRRTLSVRLTPKPFRYVVALRLAPWTALGVAGVAAAISLDEPVTTLVGSVVLVVAVHIVVWWEHRRST